MLKKPRVVLHTVFFLTALLRGAAAQLPPTPNEAARDLTPKPQVYVAQRSQDLGTILEGDKVTVTWELENRGHAELIIDRTVASCGCTVVRLAEEEKTVAPGRSLSLNAQFDSAARRDDQAKSVTVYSNDPTEPQLRLEFKATVELLYELDPVGMVNLRAIRRGQAGPRPLDIFPGPRYKELTIKTVDLPADAPLLYQIDPVEVRQRKGQRLRFTVAENAPLGQLNATATLRIGVDGIERERSVALRGEVVADLTWLPKVVDATRQPSLPGKRLTPVTVSSPEKLAFDIVEAGAGPFFEVTVEPGKSAKPRTEYSVTLTLRDAAPPGPFGTLLRISTTSLDQPLVEIPVFGIVSAPVEVEPPIVLLRADGTPAGAHRRVRLQTALPSIGLDISNLSCDNPAVIATIDQAASSKYQHIRFLDVRLNGKPGEGRHSTVLRVTTGVVGAERLEIPVTIEVGTPKPG